MNRAMKFQQEQDPITFQQPWPIVVADDGTVLHGRPDAAALIGFTDPEEPGHADGELDGTKIVFRSQIGPDLQELVGYWPVFRGREQPDGSIPMFAVMQPIASIQQWDL